MKKTAKLVSHVLALALFASSGLNASVDAAEPAASQGDHVWILTATALVLFMQAGFMLLECGMVRSKTTINVAMKNVLDFLLAAMMFWLIGFMLMFGPTIGGLFGFGGGMAAADRPSTYDLLFLCFQITFVGTAATIVSGAVSERMTFAGYALMVAALSAVIYPVFGHWAWGSALVGGEPTLLASIGFMDFAGSTVVHSVGAWAALAALVVLGPRLGRFKPSGEVQEMPGHNPVLSGCGALIIMVGWIGFNGGSALAFSDAVPQIVANTLLAGAAGGIAGMGFGRFRDGRVMKFDRIVNGLLGGLVAITAGCDVVGLQGAVAIGALGGLVAQVANDWLLHRARIDDVVGAIGVHGVAGMTGTLLVAVFAPVESLAAGGRLAQLGAQAAGVALCAVWAFGTVYAALKVIGLIVPLRVSADEEDVGLNTAEHGVTLGTGHVQQMLSTMLANEGLEPELVAVEPGDEAGELAELFNRLLLSMRARNARTAMEARLRHERLRARKQTDDEVVAEINQIIAQATEGAFHGRLDLGRANGVLATVCAGFNQLLDVMDGVTVDLASAMERLANGDLKTEMPNRGAGAFAAISANYNGSIRRLRAKEEESGAVLGAMSSEARSVTGDASSAIEAIERASREAVSIVSVIDEIARKTTLLAFNASIEAARAGGHGAAFGVVAKEVRTLATRVREATDQVGVAMDANASQAALASAAVGKVTSTLNRIEAELLSLIDREEAISKVA
ncbi:MAG: ammonium transporter [Pikeienuella sp.]|uniref:ammonium transporter n=1 Tax=Pikeienuella sp. TaxID=2831957 RepID=UPI00391B2FF8